MFKFTLTIATSVFLLMSGAADLFAMDLDETEALGIAHSVPQDVMGAILQEASKDNNPRHLTSVCKSWYHVMRENQGPHGAELHYSTINPLHLTMNPFMKQCMNTYWENQFYNGILRYTPTEDGGDMVTLKFSNLIKDETFDLSACGNNGQYLVITRSMDRFFKIEKENKDKTVILITPRYFVEQGMNDSTPQSFTALVAGWDVDQAPVGMFWRWGNDKNLSWVDSLTTAGIGGISLCNLFENWQRRDGGVRWNQGIGERMCRHFSCQFLSRNKN
ncbi:MAG: hypothetical protein H0X26_10330 [Alphaproteobacteria bacterium]|nr:hypothetical protein [Alphaproteobacteria bacterium]